MRLTVFNGSPRSEDSNSKTLLDHFLKGFCETMGHSYELFYLKQTDEIDNHCRKFQEAENIIIAFLLYFDSMPALVKNFIERHYCSY
jgi:multimeric flavodoxin WrbA